MTVCGTLVLTVNGGEGTGNNSAHAVLTDKQLACYLAIAVKLRKGYNILVRGNLEYAVRGGVYNKLSRPHVLVTVVADNVRAGVGKVAQRAPARSFLECGNNLGGEAVRICRKGTLGDNSHKLPVTDGGVLTHALFLHACHGRGGIFHLCNRINAVNVADAHGGKVGYVKYAGCGNAGKGVCPLVAEKMCVRLCPDSKGIEDG